MVYKDYLGIIIAFVLGLFTQPIYSLFAKLPPPLNNIANILVLLFFILIMWVYVTNRKPKDQQMLMSLLAEIRGLREDLKIGGTNEQSRIKSGSEHFDSVL